MDKLLQAIQFATSRHAKQLRKDNVTPFISHPLSVALILSEFTSDNEILAAGVLHDVLEDTNTTVDELKKKFGVRVAKIVFECSESDKSKSWEKRKAESFGKIKTLSKEAVLVKLADILHNMFQTVDQVKEFGPSFLYKFSASPIRKFEVERSRLEEFRKYHKQKKLILLIDGYLVLLEKTAAKLAR